MLRSDVLLEVRLRPEAVTASDPVPAFHLLAFAEVEFSADEILRLCMYRLHVHLHVAGFGELPPTTRKGALNALPIRE